MFKTCMFCQQIRVDTLLHKLESDPTQEPLQDKTIEDIVILETLKWFSPPSTETVLAKFNPKIKIASLNAVKNKNLWTEIWKSESTSRFNLVQLLKYRQNKDNSYLDYWIELISKLAKLELDNKLIQK